MQARRSHSRFGAETFRGLIDVVPAPSLTFTFRQLQTLFSALSNALRNHPCDDLGFIARKPFEGSP
jgi:hypothetical protein